MNGINLNNRNSLAITIIIIIIPLSGIFYSNP